MPFVLEVLGSIPGRGVWFVARICTLHVALRRYWPACKWYGATDSSWIYCLLLLKISSMKLDNCSLQNWYELYGRVTFIANIFCLYKDLLFIFMKALMSHINALYTVQCKKNHMMYAIWDANLHSRTILWLVHSVFSYLLIVRHKGNWIITI